MEAFHPAKCRTFNQNPVATQSLPAPQYALNGMTAQIPLNNVPHRESPKR